MMYMFALAILQGVVTYVDDGNHHSSPYAEELIYYYGSLEKTFITLIFAVSNGRDWQYLVQPLLPISHAYLWFFAFYVLFVMFGLMNVLTSIYVDSTMRISGHDKASVIQTEISRNHSNINALHEILREVDSGNSGNITDAQIQKTLDSPEVVSYLRLLGLTISET